MNYSLTFSNIGEGFISVPVVFSRAHQAMWNHSGAAAWLLCRVSAKGASGYSMS